MLRLRPCQMNNDFLYMIEGNAVDFDGPVRRIEES
jgi:hypothetical protein